MFEVSKKEANFKKLVICTAKGNGKITQISDDEYEGYIIHQNRKIKFSFRNEKFSDVGILYELIVQQEYDELFQLIKNEYDSDLKLNFIDAGGNIGLFSILAMSEFPTSHIAYIEPDNEAVAQFKKMIEFNAFQSPFFFQNGLANESGNNISLQEGPRGTENAGYVTNISSDFTGLVSINLNDIMEIANFKNVHVLKIDIEGAEEDVILGTNFNLELTNHIDIIAIEIHDSQVDRIKIEQKLEQLKFKKIHNNRVDIFQKQN